MSEIIVPRGKEKMPIPRAMAGSIAAFQESTSATDVIVIAVDRNSGEFSMGGFPKDDYSRQIEVMEKALSRLKTQARR